MSKEPKILIDNNLKKVNQRVAIKLFLDKILINTKVKNSNFK